jgi:hypothetical protein
VPILSEGHELYENVAQLLAMAEGKSVLNGNALREVVVWRPLVEARDLINGAESRLSCKVISNAYLLSE